jgi:hypothetical protein
MSLLTYFVILRIEPRAFYIQVHSPTLLFVVLFLRQGLAYFSQAGLELQISLPLPPE